MAAPFCTCGGPNTPYDPCGTCRAIERITGEVLSDSDELRSLPGTFSTEAIAELDERAADAFVTRDWTQHNAKLQALMDEALKKRVVEIFEERYNRAARLAA